MLRLSLAIVLATALAFQADVAAAASPEAKQWTLIDGKTNPLGSPLPETIEVGRVYDDKPPSGDGMGDNDPLLLPDGTLLLLSKRYHCKYPKRKDLAKRYKAASTMEVRRSADGGRTWEFLGPLDPAPDCFDMLGCLFRPEGAPPGFARAFVERRVKGDRQQTTWTYFTEDRGRTWSKRQLVFGPDPEKGVGLSHAFNGIKKLSDGTLLMPMQRYRPFLPPVVLRCRPTGDPVTMGSRREHWELLEIPHDYPLCDAGSPAAVISESDVIVRPDGSMLLIMRGSCGWMFQSESSDNGRTWSRLHRSTFGCTNSKHHLLPLRDGTLLMVHHDANNSEGCIKRSPMAVSVSRDGGFTWERTVSVGWNSFWHYGYPKGLELPSGDILYFTRYGPLHDAESIGVTRVSRRFLDTAQIRLGADGCRVENGRLHIERPEATAAAVNRLPLGYPIQTSIECTVNKLSGRFQLLSIVGEGSMELVALGVRGNGNSVEFDVFDFDNDPCRVDWRPLGIDVPLGKPFRATLTLLDPYRYRLEVADRKLEGLSAKPLAVYTARVGANVVRHGDPLRKTKIRAVVGRWDLTSGTEPYRGSPLWEAARPLYRFHCTQFAMDENGPFHGSVPRVGVDISIPQALWSGMNKRNPYLLEANLRGKRDGVLIVEKPFLGPAGTVAFYGLPLPDGPGSNALLDSPPLQLGLVKQEEHLRAYARMGEKVVRSEPLLGKHAGLCAWRWETRDGQLHVRFVHVAADGKLTPAGTGVLPPLSGSKGPVRWMNDAAGKAPFRGRMTSLGVWPRALSDNELTSLGRY